VNDNLVAQAIAPMLVRVGIETKVVVQPWAPFIAAASPPGYAYSFILIGNSGLTEAVVTETARALHDHELIKVRMSGAERTVRDAALASLAERTGSALVGRIGHVATLYRPRRELSKIVLPD
jgi:RNA-binding protein